MIPAVTSPSLVTAYDAVPLNLAEQRSNLGCDRCQSIVETFAFGKIANIELSMPLIRLLTKIMLVFVFREFEDYNMGMDYPHRTQEFRITGDALFERMDRAVEKVNERLRKTVGALEAADIPYAIVGGHAVRAWVAQVDEGAVRTTKDVDILVRPENLNSVIEVLVAKGFFHRNTAGVDIFTDLPDGSARDGIHVVLAGSIVKPWEVDPNPDVFPQIRADSFNTVPFETLVRMKLNSYRRKDQVHIQDLIAVGLIDNSWLIRFPEPLRDRLKTILDDPEG